MRGTLERSAEAWSSRADLLDRLDASFHARAALRRENTAQDQENSDGQGTGSLEQGKAQAEGQAGQGQKRARPRIKGLSHVDDAQRKDADAD
jgi:hypothetical protein